jgi:DNA-binding MarR family transcriptional regulator
MAKASSTATKPATTAATTASRTRANTTARTKATTKTVNRPKAGASLARAPAPPMQFSQLPTFRLETLASITGRHGEMLYQRLFGLRLVECQLLGIVRAHEPVSLRRACLELGIDKSLGSRLVSRQIQAGLLERRDDPADQRSFYLLLSKIGRELIVRINQAATERNRDWMAGFPVEMQAVFLDLVDSQITHARAMLDQEMRRSRRRLPPRPAHEGGPAPAREAGPVLMDRELLLDFHRRLGDLLGQVDPSPR